MANTARERLVRAALDLFAGEGFEQTTVDQIAARAGVGRSTFFRHFPTKESVVFPDHDALLTAVEARLRSGGATTVAIALVEAARIVLDHYLDEDDVARERYRLTRTVPSLRNTEIAGQHRYQRLFRQYLQAWAAAAGHPDDLRAEVLANAVVTAHNHVLRSWLRGGGGQPRDDLEAAVADLTSRLWPDTDRAGETHVVVLRTQQDLDRLLPELERVLR